MANPLTNEIDPQPGTWQWLQAFVPALTGQVQSDPLGIHSPGGPMGTNPDSLISRIYANPIGAETLPQSLVAARPGVNVDPVNSLRMTTGADALSNLAVAAGLAFAPGTIGGTFAKTANLGALERAVNSEASGMPNNATWQLHGWELGADGRWRFEIPDQGAKLKGITVGPEGQVTSTNPALKPNPFYDKQVTLAGRNNKLSDVLDHPELFQAYPHMADMPVNQVGFEQAMRNVKGSYSPTTKSISLTTNTPQDTLNTLLHENQHAVQHYEGFANGGNSRMMMSPEVRNFVDGVDKQSRDITGTLKKVYGDDYNNPYVTTRQKYKDFQDATNPSDGAVPQDLVDYYTRAWNETKQKLASAGVDVNALTKHFEDTQVAQTLKMDAFLNYQKIAGEVEARNVEQRAKLPPELMKDMPPSQTAEFGPKDQIVLPAIPYNP